MRISDWSSDVCSSDLHDYDLNGKRIAVIGTGASAIQFVPQIVPKVAHLDLFQRTPPWIMPKPDREISARARKLFRLLDRQRVVQGQSVSVRVDTGGDRIF